MEYNQPPRYYAFLFVFGSFTIISISIFIYRAFVTTKLKLSYTEVAIQIIAIQEINSNQNFYFVKIESSNSATLKLEGKSGIGKVNEIVITFYDKANSRLLPYDKFRLKDILVGITSLVLIFLMMYAVKNPDGILEHLNGESGFG